MKIIKHWPPNIEDIRAACMNPTEQTVFTYGEDLYVPGNVVIPGHLMAHEEVHSRQQLEMPGGPEAWWKKYINDKSFRLAQEIEAYVEQFRHYHERHANPRKRILFLNQLSTDLSSKLYGNIISYGEAYGAIRNNLSL